MDTIRGVCSGEGEEIMSKIIRTQKPSVLPYYAAALVFAVLCAVLPVYKLRIYGWG